MQNSRHTWVANLWKLKTFDIFWFYSTSNWTRQTNVEWLCSCSNISADKTQNVLLHLIEIFIWNRVYFSDHIKHQIPVMLNGFIVNHFSKSGDVKRVWIKWTCICLLMSGKFAHVRQLVRQVYTVQTDWGWQICDAIHWNQSKVEHETFSVFYLIEVFI